MSEDEKRIRKTRAISDFKLNLLTFVNNFESELEPNIKLTEDDKLYSLASIVSAELKYKINQ